MARGAHLSLRPLLVGILNATPDSFSDGGRFVSPDRAVAHGLRLLDEGADLLDVGGESTRPGADDVPEAEELRRVLPVIRGVLAERPGAKISVDTRKAAVAAEALAAGAAVVNDTSAFSDPEMVGVCARSGAGVVLMHMRGTPATMQTDTRYDDLVGEVLAFLLDRAARAVAAGVPRDRISLDPGLGFGKSSADNPKLIAAIPRFLQAGFPVWIGASRKRFVGELSGVKSPEDRVFGSIGAAIAAAARGAGALRVHDVRATREALDVWYGIAGVSP